MAERQFGPYRLIRQIAVGGMAEIHLAKTAGIAGFEKYVALKMIHPNFAADEQFIQMLVDEAKIAVQLTHGNIAQTFDLGRVGDTYYITMEYVDGADLYKILRRASEQDREIPLDVCAFIGKEISSALDHAHRKRDHTGRSLGIVHRDVSPQNVLVSYSGEVKLVDFGIAKATMKVRQTAVGVIKGKYYYMSPEQAWGDPIDHRSDIFSAGIVLYEMITGQMLYLEEDLHKLLEMARSANIEPPSLLRRGVPPQLERIVMHALERVPGERYQSAGDFATDLERFLHAYSPVFTASKLSTLLREVVGDPLQVPDDPAFHSVEFRDGVMSTHPLDDAEVAHATDRAELRDENSVIFRVSELDRRAMEDAAEAAGWNIDAADAAEASGPGAPRRKTPPPLPGTSPRSAPPRPPPRQTAPRVTRAADPLPLRPVVTARLPSVAPPRPAGAAKIPHIVKPREPNEETRKLEPAPANPLQDDSGLLTPEGKKLVVWDDSERNDEYVEGFADRTVVTGAPGMGFMMDFAGEDADGFADRTLITSAPLGLGFTGEEDSTVERQSLRQVERQLARPAQPPARSERPSSRSERPSSRSEGPERPERPERTERPSSRPEQPERLDDRQPERLEDDAPTQARDFAVDHPTNPVRLNDNLSPPAALSAKIHAPAVSEIRKPRPSRRTPAGGGVRPHPPSVLHAIVSSQASEPMPAPRPALRPPSSQLPPGQQPPSGQPIAQSAVHPAVSSSKGPAPMAMGPGPMAPMAMGQAPQPAVPMTQSQQLSLASTQPMPPIGPAQAYAAPPVASPMAVTMPEASRTPADPFAPQFSIGGSGGPAPGFAAPPGGYQNPGGVPPYLVYPQMQVAPPGYPQQPLATQMSPHGYPQLLPGALYPFQTPPQEMSLTGQMRAAEIDELPSHYKLGAARARWFTYIVSGVLAVSVAAAVTFLIIRSMRDSAPQVGSVYINSVPAGADVLFEGTRLRDKTPLTIDKVPVGTHPTIRIELAHYGPHEQILDVPRSGAEISVMAYLKAITGKIIIDSVPPGAEIHINGRMRGRTPTTISDVDMDSAKMLELRLKDYQLFVQDLVWPADGRIQINAKLVR